MSSEKTANSGWDAIEQEFLRVYPGQTEVLHYGTLIKRIFGGNDPLDGVSIYDGGSYWHFVSFGLTELNEKESEDKDVSGFGYELTLKLKKDCIEEGDQHEEFSNIVAIMQNLARHIFSGEIFQPNEWISFANEYDDGLDCSGGSRLTGFILIKDTTVNSIMTPNGSVDFLELVGVTTAETKTFTGRDSVEAFFKELGSDVTDYYRKSIVYDEEDDGWNDDDCCYERVSSEGEEDQEARRQKELIHEAFLKAYPDQTDPISYKGISIFDGGTYWHFVSSGVADGLRELLGEMQEDDSSPKGTGYELTFKLKKGCYEDEDAEFDNVSVLFELTVKLSLMTGELLHPNSWFPESLVMGIDADHESELSGLIFVKDPSVETVSAPDGNIDFLELVGITAEELESLSDEKSVSDLLAKIGTDITDYQRQSVE